MQIGGRLGIRGWRCHKGNGNVGRRDDSSAAPNPVVTAEAAMDEFVPSKGGAIEQGWGLETRERKQKFKKSSNYADKLRTIHPRLRPSSCVRLLIE